MRTDRLLASLLGAEALGASLLALLGMGTLPAWRLAAAAVAPALVAGGLVWKRAGETATRHVVVAAQLLMAPVFADLTNGRLGFSLFAVSSLALISFYRDAHVLWTAGATLVGSWVVFGIGDSSSWEVGTWLVFGGGWIVLSAFQGRREQLATSLREAELEITQASIEQSVIIRTVELAEARDQALEAVELKSQFLANMSHEIRTPMNGVLGFVELLLDSEPTETQRSYLETVRGSGESLMTILNDILDFSKIEAGKLELELVDFDLFEVVRQVGDLMRAQARSKSLVFEVECSGSSPRLRGDPTRLRQVLSNLVGNAIKFTQEGEVRVRAEISDDHHPRQVRLTVSDTGIGIPEEQRRLLFQPFTQGDGSTTRRFGGTGLGLAISRRLVDMMGGTIGVESEFGKGSTFQVIVGLNPARPIEPEATEAQEPEVTSFRPARVLLVEDNPVNRRLVQLMLERVGHTVDTAENGAMALDRFEPGRYDVILMDAQMPRMDGYEATRVIRSREKDVPPVPILALTARAMKGDRERCLEAGMTDYLTKPVSSATLLGAIEQWTLRGALPIAATESSSLDVNR